MQDYLVYGHVASRYAYSISCRYDSYALLLSGRSRETDSYKRLLQRYSFSSLSGRVVLHRYLTYIHTNPKSEQLPRPGSDFPLYLVLLVPLDTYPYLPVLVMIFQLPPGLSVPVLLILLYFSCLIDRAPADVHPSIADLFEKVFFEKWLSVVLEALEAYFLCTERCFYVGLEIVS